MQTDFHYYATYCAAFLAGYTPDQCKVISHCAQLPDWCTQTFLGRINAPRSAATTQLKLELANANTDMVGLQEITRIWSSFHFLPGDIDADVNRGNRRYREKYRLICNTNGPLLVDTVKLAKDKGLEAAGLSMHILADTWAHRYFAGTPSLVINNVSNHLRELIPNPDPSSDVPYIERRITFGTNEAGEDDPKTGSYISSIFQIDESSIMNLGHGRAGHLPDYSFARYTYLPAWNEYRAVIKDNPSEYYHAFCQMVYALRYLRDDIPDFEVDQYAWDIVKPWESSIRSILEKRQLDSCEDWRSLGEQMTGVSLNPFMRDYGTPEYLDATNSSERNDTLLGRFILAALAQKSMVTHKVYASGNLLAGRSVEVKKGHFRGVRDFAELVRHYGRGNAQ